MESLLFHPKVVHLPMALAVLMPLVSAGLLFAWWRKWFPPRTWIVAAVLQGALLASGIVALRSGENEEDRVERFVPEAAIEAHEEAAEVFVGTGAGVLGLFLLGWVLSGRKEGFPVAIAATVGTVVVLGLGVRVGEAGGELVYRHGAAAAYVNGGTTEAGEAALPSEEPEEDVAKGEEDEDEDD